MSDTKPLKRILGTPTAWLIGMGVAIGSGIFRTPGEVAGVLGTPWLIIAAWLAAGLVVLLQGLVTAELATRFPRAGGEYVYLREAYGEFVAFFFGWAYTIFIIGGSVAAIAAAFGDFTSDLVQVDPAVWSGPLAAAAIVAITGINTIGLRVGAGAQNALTVIKIVALLAMIVLGLSLGSGIAARPTTAPASGASGIAFLPLFIGAMLPALWAYDGTTDSVKMAEEIKDVLRALPRAIVGATLTLIVLYVLVNVAVLRILSPAEMAGHASAPGEAMSRLFGPKGRNAMLIVAMVACLGSVSSTMLATIRVTFALARDGLAFGFMSRMSRTQAPVPALLIVAAFAIVLALNRDFRQMLNIYFFAAAILFGLSYGSLIVFRWRERERSERVFRCPFGPILSAALILFQLALAVNIAWNEPKDMLYTSMLLLVIGGFYLVWKRFAGTTRASE